MSNKFYIDRTCTEITYNTETDEKHPKFNIPLEKFRTQDTYVLLGEPGIGKTISFEQEAGQPDCEYIRARDFIALDIQETWKSKTLFIDGLDEVRIGSSNGLIPLDAIRNKLLALRKPKFRISCRESDWLGSDSSDLAKVTSGNHITELHLEEFDKDEIRRFASHEDPSLDIKKFMDWSKKHNLMPMLRNPQILKLIIKAVSTGIWPENKKEVYQIACEKMVSETNYVHLQRNETKIYSEKQIMDAAGKLFAHQLLAGREGYSNVPADAPEYYPYYRRIFSNDIEVLGLSLKTNLFKHGVENIYRDPIHRSIAEYLAANYICDRVEKGLPIYRMLSLMTSADGNVVSSLRGLFAWFLTLCSSQRELLLDRDPLGVVLYGDVTAFSKIEKEKLFLCLYEKAKEHSGFRSENWSSAPFGALATDDMENVIRNFLESSSRDDPHQALVDCALDAIEHGQVLPNLLQTVLSVVKDHKWRTGIRQKALRVYTKISADNNTNQLLQILNGIYNNEIEDIDDQLLGNLLTQLYPRIINADNIFDYLHHSKNKYSLGSYKYFWVSKLLDKTKDKNIATLLDQLSQKKELRDIIHQNFRFHDFISKLLIRGISIFGDEICTARLYDWLGVGLDKYGYLILESDSKNGGRTKIRQWLSTRPNIYKAILAEGVFRYVNDITEWDYWEYFEHVISRLYGTKAPDDIGVWYLKQAETTKIKNIAEEYFRQAVYQLLSENFDKKYKSNPVTAWLEKHPKFNEIYKSIIDTNRKRDEENLKRKRRTAIIEENENVKKTEYLDQIIKYKEDIKNGTASSTILRNLARAYNGHLIEAKGDTPQERLLSFLNDSRELTANALAGLKNTIFRDDLPTVEDIIKTSSIGKTYSISYPVLVGLIERSDWERISDSQYGKAIAFYLTNNPDSSTPKWLTKLLETKPDLVSKILVQYVRTSARSGKEHISGLYQLAYDTKWQAVAAHTVLTLLEKFPVRIKNSQIADLEYLLKAALRYADKSIFINLIDKKLSFHSMNTMQRSRWLGTGLIIDPEKYEKDTIDFMEKGITSIRAIANVLSTGHETWQPESSQPKYRFSATTLASLIRKFGSHFKPNRYRGLLRVTTETKTADLVSDFIQKLSRIANSTATKEFENLLNFQELSEWHDDLKGELYEHRKRVRDATFRQPNIEQVVKTLSNAEPANAADLMALTLDNLKALAIKIRRSNTNDYRQYWNVDQYNHPKTPKVEDACRDVLLSDLKVQLEKIKVNAEKEGYFAEDKRSDIIVSYMGVKRIITPVEIKRSSHADVWKALWSQLIEKYTLDPDAQGYGIYLIFWFGAEDLPPPPTGKKPSTADEMKKSLLDMMSDEEKRLISVCMIDCSKR